LDEIVKLAGLAGEIMLKNGAETYRVEETMEHIAKACGAAKVESFVIPTGVFLTVADSAGQLKTAMWRVHGSTINLDRVAKVNELSRRLANRRINCKDAYNLLRRIDTERTGFSLVPSMVASGAVGGTTAILQNGGFAAVAGAFCAAFAVRYIAHIVSRRQGVQFTFEFLGGMTAALVGGFVHALWPQVGHDAIIIGGIMPLVPGVAITNSIRDVIAGDLLSGLSRGMEAALTAMAVTMGVVIGLAVQM
jgi:uncharacterized membrane protein YjjP (DUF1212 family)